MARPRRRRWNNRNHIQSRNDHSKLPDLATPNSTGSEAAFLKSLVDSRAKVTVVLKNGEELRGRIRYYDRDCFSVGQAEGGPKIFLRKSSVLYIREE